GHRAEVRSLTASFAVVLRWRGIAIVVAGFGFEGEDAHEQQRAFVFGAGDGEDFAVADDVAVLHAVDVGTARDPFWLFDQGRRALHAALVSRNRDIDRPAEIETAGVVVVHGHADNRPLGIGEHDCAVDGHDYPPNGLANEAAPPSRAAPFAVHCS